VTQRAFTAEQQAVIDHESGHAIVSAVAGSGKTTVLVERIAHLVHGGADPAAVLVMQFNKSAQLQFAARLRNRMKGHAVPEVRTFHSIGLGLSKRLVAVGALPPATTPKGGVQDKFARTAMRDAWREANGQGSYPAKEDFDGFLQFLTLVKAQTRPVDEFFARAAYPPRYRVFVDAFHRFEAARLAKKYRFFDDMLWEPVLALMKRPELWSAFQRFDFILADEFQDTNEVQYELIKGLAGDRAQVTVVGDVDQVIYTWRGARPDLQLHQFAKDFTPCTRYPMSYTFRFGHAVALMATQVVVQNIHRDDKIVIAHQSNPHSTIRRIPYKDLRDSGLVRDLAPLHQSGQLRRALLLVRYYSHAVPLELELARAGIPFHTYGRAPLVYVPEIACMFAALALAANHWPIEQEMREIFLGAMLRVPTLYLPEEEVDAIAKDMASRSMTSPRSVHQPLVAHAQAIGRERANVASRLRERADAIALMASGGLANDKPEVIIGAYLRLTGFLDRVSGQFLRAEDANEAQANVKAFAALAASHESAVSLLDMLGPMAAHEEQRPPDGDHLAIMSVHRAKGLEAHQVYVAGLGDGAFPRGGEDDNAEEERRLAYVAFTRAMHELILLHPTDTVLDTHIGDLAAAPTPNEQRLASPYLYDGEIGLSRTIAEAIQGRATTEITCRDPRVVTRYLAEARISGITFKTAAGRSGAQPLRRITPHDRIRPGMGVWTERHGVCTTVRLLYGPVWSLKRQDGEMVHEALPNNAWMIPGDSDGTASLDRSIPSNSRRPSGRRQ
jgi:DNA helicase-2/ATP-dependent DNA helicase PcrA